MKLIARIVLLTVLAIGLSATAAYADNNKHQFVVKRGDSLSKYFSSLGLSKRLLANLLAADHQNKRLNQLNVGDKITIQLKKNKRFKSLSHQSIGKNKITITLHGYDFYTSSNGTAPAKQTLDKTVVVIKHSFGADAQKKGLSLSAINTVVDALSWDLDFGSDLQTGDQFIIIGKGDKPEAIIYKGNNKRIEAFAYGDKNGQTHYYNRYGKSLNSSFLKAPLKYKRISSKFQLKRYHPILKTYRPHRAVDYAADYGTPVYSTADGVIKTKGRKGALGKSVSIKHGANYVTVYAHLSNYARGLHTNKKVKRGQTIGYVGSTGRSTGPHLHYELRYKGKRKNPLTYKTPKQKSISRSQLWDFRTKVNQILNSL